MSGVLGVLATIELAAIPGIDEQLDRIAQRPERTGEAAGFARQPREIVPQVRIVAFDRVGLTLVGQRLMLPGVVDQIGVSGQLVGVILTRRGRGVEQDLESLRLTIIGDVVSDDAASRPVYLCDEVDPLFSPLRRCTTLPTPPPVADVGSHAVARVTRRAASRRGPRPKWPLFGGPRQGGVQCAAGSCLRRRTGSLGGGWPRSNRAAWAGACTCAGNIRTGSVGSLTKSAQPSVDGRRADSVGT